MSANERPETTARAPMTREQMHAKMRRLVDQWLAFKPDDASDLACLMRVTMHPDENGDVLRFTIGTEYMCPGDDDAE